MGCVSGFSFFLILLFAVFGVDASLASNKDSKKDISNKDLIEKEKFIIKELSDRLNKIQNKYFEYRVMDFSRLEKNRYKAYVAYSSAESKGIKGEKLEDLHLKYLEALHFELKQKLLTLEGMDALTFESMKNDFWQGVYEDVDWIVKNLDWSNVFKNITDCFKELDKDKCLDITGHITNLVLELVEKTWKRRFIVDMERRINATPQIAEYLWDSMVMPKVDDTPAQKVLDKIGEKMNDKLKEKLQKEAEKKLKDQLIKGIGKYRGLTAKELKEKLKEEAKSKADSLFASVVFGSELLKKSVQIWIGEELIEDQLQTQKRLIELARMAANYDCRKRRHKDVCDDLVNEYYFDRKALAKKLRQIKAASSIPATPNIKGYVAPNSNGISKIERVTETINPEHKTKKQNCKTDIEKYKGALLKIDNLFSGGSISFDEYVEASDEVFKELRNRLLECYGGHLSGKMDKEFNELYSWYRNRRQSYYNRCLSIKNQLDGMFSRFQAGLNKYRKEGMALAKDIKEETKSMGIGFRPRDYALIEQKKRHIEDMLEKLDDKIEECRKYVDDFVKSYEMFAEANYMYFFEEGAFKPASCLYGYDEPYSWGYRVKMRACKFDVDPIDIGNRISQIEDETEANIVNMISQKEGDKDADENTSIIPSYQRYLPGDVLSLAQKGVEKRRQINKLFADYLEFMVQIINPEYVKKQRSLIKKDVMRILYLDKKYRSGRINDGDFVREWSITASDIKRRYNKVLHICKLSKDGVPNEWDYNGKSERIRQLLIELSERIRKINDISRRPLFSELELARIDIYNDLWDRYSVRNWMYFIPEREKKSMAPYLLRYINSDGHDRAVDCNCPDCYCCYSSHAAFMHTFLNRYPQDIIAARNADMPIVVKKCKKVEQLNKILDSLDKRYDHNTYKQAEKVYKELFVVDDGYVLSKRYRQNPFLKYPCGVYLAMKRFEEYSIKPVRLDPNKDFCEIEINSTPLSKLKKLFKGSNFIKIYSTSPNLSVKTYRASEGVKRFTKEVYLRICPIIVAGSNQNDKLRAECENKPMIKVSSNYNFNYVYKMPIKGAVYRIEVSCVLKDRTSIAPRDCPVSVYWVSNTTDKDEEEGEGKEQANPDSYKEKKPKETDSHKPKTNKQINGDNNGKAKPPAAKSHQPSKHKDISGTDNSCKGYYKAYVEAYNRVVKLMSSGKGNTDEARKAYGVYKKARERYMSCKNRSKSNITTQQPNHSDEVSKKEHHASNYIGCFSDRGDPYGLKGRDLHGAALFNDSKMTPDRCMAYCKEKGFRYAAVQYGSQCFCGNSYGRYGKSKSCNMHCSGDRNQICGGVWANSVYSVNGQATGNKNDNIIYNTAEGGEDFLGNNQNNNSYKTDNNYEYLGCFKDQGDPYGLRAEIWQPLALEATR